MPALNVNSASLQVEYVRARPHAAVDEGWSHDHGDEWRMDAACLQYPPDLWFPEQGGSSREAQRICRGCPVKVECLTYALEYNERYGVWGGTTETGRRGMRPARLDCRDCGAVFASPQSLAGHRAHSRCRRIA